MARITTRKGEIILVDDLDYVYLKDFTWRLDPNGYPVRTERKEIEPGKKQPRPVYMHRQILGLSPHDSLMGDHIDGNPLNNHRDNLRVVTPAQNSMNRGKHFVSSSKHKGVTWNKKSQKWQVMCKGEYLGVFINEADAVAAYKEKAKLVFGIYNRAEL